MTAPGGLQAITNAPMAIGSAIGMSQARKPALASGDQPRYGLSLWFKVVVHLPGSGAKSLGLWSGCSGLGVTLTPEQFKAGGTYDGTYILPGEISYGQVTLERAMERVGSDQVRDWLVNVASKWINADEAGAPESGFEGTTVDISLFSNLKQQEGQEIAKWTLQYAIPVSWTGPVLSAKGTDVAVEKLTLAHQGFLKAAPPVPSKGKPAPSQPNQGKLSLSLDSDSLDFQYNPVKVTLAKTVTVKNPSMLATTIEQQVTDPGKLSVTIGELRLEGVTAVRTKVDKLFEWLTPYPPDPQASSPPKPNTKPGGSTPGSSGTGSDEDKGNAAKPKILALKMGAGTGAIERKVLLKVLNVVYQRFTSTSVPSRASVTLTLEEVEDPPPPPNPSSFGHPGGQVHLVTEGENLQRLATATYGRPSAWRHLAEANGIDDPLRVRNGRTLYLPPR